VLTLSDAQQASLTPSIIQQARDRDGQCIFSGVVPSCDSPLVVTWVFPPFMGYEVSMQHFDRIYANSTQLSPDPWLESRYYQDPNGCDLSELLVAENVVSGRKDLIALFWENKLGVDVDVRSPLFALGGCGNCDV
jgi:hypothetical protein